MPRRLRAIARHLVLTGGASGQVSSQTSQLQASRSQAQAHSHSKKRKRAEEDLERAQEPEADPLIESPDEWEADTIHSYLVWSIGARL